MCDDCRAFKNTMGRPNVHCAFTIMDRCDVKYDDTELAQACREGARDAHLLSCPQRMYKENDKQEAYESGNFTTFFDCVPHALHLI